MTRYTVTFAVLSLFSVAGLVGCKADSHADHAMTHDHADHDHSQHDQAIEAEPPTIQPEFADALAEVKGMSCPLCAFSIKSVFMKQNAVSDVQLDMQKGLALILFKPGQALTAEQITQAIKDAGFTPGNVTLNTKAGG